MPVRPLVRLLVTLLLGLAWLLPSGPADAQYCNIRNTAGSLEMGTLSSAGASTSGVVNFFCSHSSPESRTYSVCLFMNPQAYTPGVAPRTMVNSGQPPYPHVVNFDLYADPGHTQILGSETSGHLIYSTSVHVPAGVDGVGREAAGALPVYALMPPGQVVAEGGYVSQLEVSLHYASQAGDVPPEAPLCAAGAEQGHYMEVRGTGAAACAVSIATDLDFGEVSSLTVSHDQTSTIHLICPLGTTWQLGLDNGMHESGGQRRMADSDGTAFVPYELYRDASHADPWGDELDTDTYAGEGTGSLQQIPVHGQTLPQSPTPPTGVYSDTITVTLTF